MLCFCRGKRLREPTQRRVLWVTITEHPKSQPSIVHICTSSKLIGWANILVGSFLVFFCFWCEVNFILFPILSICIEKSKVFQVCFTEAVVLSLGLNWFSSSTFSLRFGLLNLTMLCSGPVCYTLSPYQYIQGTHMWMCLNVTCVCLLEKQNPGLMPMCLIREASGNDQIEPLMPNCKLYFGRLVLHLV